MAGLTLSYVHGASEQPLIGQTVGQFFDAVCEQYPARPALVVRHQNVRLSYAELRREVDKLAAGLLTLGLDPGDRIGIWSPNNCEWVLTQFATAKAGLILVNINPAYRIAELEYALNKVGCKALILAERFKTSDYIGILANWRRNSAMRRRASSNRRACRRCVRWSCSATPGIPARSGSPTSWRAARRERRSVSPRWRRSCNSTSRSISSSPPAPPAFPRARRCRITISSITASSSAKRCGSRRKTGLCIPVPLYHCFGMVLGNLAAVTHGACMVFPGEGFDPLVTLETVAEERCTALHGVPTMFIAELDHPEFGRFDLSSLRTGIMAGSPCPIEVMKRCVAKMHLSEITIAYGMTETSPVSFQSSTD